MSSPQMIRMFGFFVATVLSSLLDFVLARCCTCHRRFHARGDDPLLMVIPAALARVSSPLRCRCAPPFRTSSGAWDTSVRPSLDPGLRSIKHPEVTTDLQLSVLDPHFRLVDLAVLVLDDRTAFVVFAAAAEVFDDQEADDGFVVIVSRAFRADLGFPVRIVRLRQADDLAEDLS